MTGMRASLGILEGMLDIRGFVNDRDRCLARLFIGHTSSITDSCPPNPSERWTIDGKEYRVVSRFEPDAVVVSAAASEAAGIAPVAPGVAAAGAAMELLVLQQENEEGAVVHTDV